MRRYLVPLCLLSVVSAPSIATPPRMAGKILFHRSDDGNAAPLLRLLAENQVTGQSGGPANSYTEYSQATFVSISCSDYSQIYNMTLGLSQRREQRDWALTSEQQQPNVYAPFTMEFDAMPLDTSVLDLCLNWPAPTDAPIPPGQPVPPGAQFTKAPVLVLSGDLDSLTPALQEKRAAGLFQNSQQIIVPNSFHATATGDEDNCASIIAQSFVSSLDPGDTSCTNHIAEVHVVPKFVSAAADVSAATATEGSQGSDADLRVAAAAAHTAGDALARWWVNTTGPGAGLQGGHFQYNSPSNLTYHTQQAEMGGRPRSLGEHEVGL